jgi:hypothetical protein
MITKQLFRGSDAPCMADGVHALYSGSAAAGRARLLYKILHDQGLDEMKEIQGVW